MKALVYRGDHKITLEEKPKPSIKNTTDVIVKVLKTTICGTDLGIYKGKNLYMKEGVISGTKALVLLKKLEMFLRKIAAHKHATFHTRNVSAN